MAGSRGNGEGSIYQRTSDGRWLGVVYPRTRRHGTRGPKGRVCEDSGRGRSQAQKVAKRSRRRTTSAGHENDGGPIAHPLA